MNELETGLKRMKKTKDLRILSLLEALPALDLFEKLLHRKASSKKPFVSFDTASALSKVDEQETYLRSCLTEKNPDFDKAGDILSDLSDFALKAQEEIQMASLRADYQWIADTFRLSSKTLSGK